MAESLVVTVEEAAGILGVGRNTAYMAVKLGTLPSVKVGRRILIPKVALSKWLEAAGDAPILTVEQVKGEREAARERSRLAEEAKLKEERKKDEAEFHRLSLKLGFYDR